MRRVSSGCGTFGVSERASTGCIAQPAPAITSARRVARRGRIMASRSLPRPRVWTKQKGQDFCRPDLFSFCEPGKNRTYNPGIKSPLLYQLSYRARPRKGPPCTPISAKVKPLFSRPEKLETSITNSVPAALLWSTGPMVRRCLRRGAPRARRSGQHEFGAVLFSAPAPKDRSDAHRATTRNAAPVRRRRFSLVNPG
jgi:hypothetical protein